jgi:hypothetical protein
MTDVAIDEIDLKINKYKLESQSLLKFKVKKLILVFYEFYIYFEFEISKKTVEFDSIKTDIICIEYSDKLFITVSSSGKFGAVVI